MVNELGKWLRELRGFDVTQKELAKEMGLASNGYLSRVEGGLIKASDLWKKRARRAAERVREKKLKKKLTQK
jgi:transcriptional regulator with XRE-family HTH domain